MYTLFCLKVRDEVRVLIKNFDHPEGDMGIVGGTGILSGTSSENSEAILDEACKCGELHRRQYSDT